MPSFTFLLTRVMLKGTSGSKIPGTVAKAAWAAVSSIVKKEGLFSKITDTLNKIKNALKSFGKKIITFFKKIPGALKSLGEKIVTFFKGIPEAFKSLGSQIKKGYRKWEKANPPGQWMPLP